MKIHPVSNYLAFISPVVESGGFVFTAAIPREPETLRIPETFREQVELTFANLSSALGAAGTSVEKLVKVNVYLGDIQNWAEFNTLYEKFVSQAQPPMRVAMQVALNNAYMVEIDVIAEAGGA
ncbi:RidA family protein [Mycobacterium sp. AZCC_0083]|uniref:RidA family protein n=1 Tax=Mycobacterium sp. AZCC_0083 TaxID=2735882 RepID=UPI0016126C10|nr:RidA family protein [Mycobacterium sp. AZCC_0083]MBB5167527.1 2-iminobutanoate/2-iminopropanoate deaminase [Mycobacterium sp. AZCC_0083]